jgi:valyl-tRNA synthetase
MWSRASATVTAVDRAFAEYAFGEGARILYDAIWNEFCDWGIEFAKVRLADQTLPARDREATWWALVEVLDTYLRLLHPLMPFVTEAIWEAAPHRATDPPLLIQARWPGAGSRDQALEVDVEAILEVIRAIRNARAEAKVEPAAPLPVHVVMPVALGAVFEALRPAIERLVRARPLVRHLTPEALHAAAGQGGLVVIAGEIEAVVGGGQGTVAVGDLDRARLERELAQAAALLEVARARLLNEAFVANAPPRIVEGAREREAELADQVARLGDRIGR